MTKRDIERELAHKCNFTIQNTETLIDNLYELIKECLESGDEFQLTGLLTIKYKDKKPRIQCNPKTNQRFMSKHRKLTIIEKGSLLKRLDKDVEQ